MSDKTMLEAFDDLNDALIALGDNLQDVAKAYLRAICNAFVIPAHIILDIPEHERLPGESLRQWGNRLERRGLMDNPDARWHYQKTVLSAPFRKIRSLFR